MSADYDLTGKATETGTKYILLIRYVAIHGPSTINEIHKNMDLYSKPHLRDKLNEFCGPNKLLKIRKEGREYKIYIDDYKKESDRPIAAAYTEAELKPLTSQIAQAIYKIIEGTPPSEVYPDELYPLSSDPPLQRTLRLAIEDTDKDKNRKNILPLDIAGSDAKIAETIEKAKSYGPLIRNPYQDVVSQTPNPMRYLRYNILGTESPKHDFSKRIESITFQYTRQLEKVTRLLSRVAYAAALGVLFLPMLAAHFGSHTNIFLFKVLQSSIILLITAYTLQYFTTLPDDPMATQMPN